MARFQANIRTAFLSTAAMAFSASAFGQTVPPTPPAAQPSAQSAPATPTAPPAANQSAPAHGTLVSDDQIHKFALAYLEIQKIQKSYAPQLESTSADQKTVLKQKANSDMAAAVKAQGLDPETFNAIAQQVTNDPQLREKIGQEVAKLQPSPGTR